MHRVTMPIPAPTYTAELRAAYLGNSATSPLRALVEPVFIEHLLRHKGAKVVIMTTAGKLMGSYPALRWTIFN